MRMHTFKKAILLSSLTCLLMGCSSDKEIADTPVEELYNQAKDKLDDGSYSGAAKLFSEVERQHPYSVWALKAQLMSAYSYYEAKKYDEAIEGFKTFIQLHPGHENIAYAYYMIGLCDYEQIPTVQRSQEATERAKNAFQEVINRFPGSPYAKDAKYKLDLIVDHFAGKEMEVGRYYLGQKAYIAALNRFKAVIDQYQTSSFTPEALHRMVECYLGLGIHSQAKATAAILGYNYPGSHWYAESYALLKSENPKLVLPKKQEAATLQKEAAPTVEKKPKI